MPGRSYYVKAAVVSSVVFVAEFRARLVDELKHELGTDRATPVTVAEFHSSIGENVLRDLEHDHGFVIDPGLLEALEQYPDGILLVAGAYRRSRAFRRLNGHDRRAGWQR